jgi:hypothetical protein
MTKSLLFTATTVLFRPNVSSSGHIGLFIATTVLYWTTSVLFRATSVHSIAKSFLSKATTVDFKATHFPFRSYRSFKGRAGLLVPNRYYLGQHSFLGQSLSSLGTHRSLLLGPHLSFSCHIDHFRAKSVLFKAISVLFRAY